MILFHVSKERGIFVNYIELSVFIAYFIFMVAIGLYFFSKSKGAGERITSSAAATWVRGCPLCPPVLPI